MNRRLRFSTLLKEKGISWQAGEARQVYNTRTGEVTTIAPDEVASFEVEQFNKYVITENFNRVICEKLTEYLDPYSWEKTLIFCATDDHADMVVDLLKLAFEKKYGSVDDRAVMKITGKTDQPLQKIREFKNELYPNVAVTVDLLTTGVDVPAICNLVFLQRVNSRILYEQMLGRATRQCDDIQKKVFRIFDAVGLYEGMQEYSEMRPVVKKPNITVSQLLDELSNTSDPAVMDDVLDQLLVKLRRKESDLIEDDLLAIQNTLNLPYSAMLAKIQYGDRPEVQAWLRDGLAVGKIFDRAGQSERLVFISEHEDAVIGTEIGYGNATRPDDYLENFQRFIRENMNSIPALLLVTQRPRNLTRQDLKDLLLQLKAAGYSETNLQVAWREKTNQEIAASIIGFIRQAALGDPLIPYEERVRRAVNKILASQSWTYRQREFFEKIKIQLVSEKLVDRQLLDNDFFKDRWGGFKRLDRRFEGKLMEIIEEINEAICQV